MRTCKRGRVYSTLGKFLLWPVHEEIQRKKTNPETTQNKKKAGFLFGEREVQCRETGLGIISIETIFKTCFHTPLLKLDVQAEKG